MKVITSNLLNRFWKNGVKPIKDEMGSKINTSKIINNLLTTKAGYVLDARQGKVLQNELDEINSNLSAAMRRAQQGLQIYDNMPYIRQLDLTPDSFTKYVKGQAVPWSDTVLKDNVAWGAPVTTLKGDYAFNVDPRIIVNGFTPTVGQTFVITSNLVLLDPSGRYTTYQAWRKDYHYENSDAFAGATYAQQMILPLIPSSGYIILFINNTLVGAPNVTDGTLTNIFSSWISGLSQGQ